MKKELSPCVTCINGKEIYYKVDLGTEAKQRFALYRSKIEGKPIKKSNNPLDFDEIIFKGAKV